MPLPAGALPFELTPRTLSPRSYPAETALDVLFLSTEVLASFSCLLRDRTDARPRACVLRAILVAPLKPRDRLERVAAHCVHRRCSLAAPIAHELDRHLDLLHGSRQDAQEPRQRGFLVPQDLYPPRAAEGSRPQLVAHEEQVTGLALARGDPPEL